MCAKTNFELDELVFANPLPVLIFDEEGKMIFTNPTAEDFAKSIGFKRDELKRLLPMNFNQKIKILDNAEKVCQIVDINHKRFKGRLIFNYSLFNSRKNVFVAIQDITQQKILEETIREGSNEKKRLLDEIRASLKEKELLLREIHHRVRNNMQVISSLLNLQSGYIKDELYSEMFKDCQNRIKSMALIHEKLYLSKNMAKIDFNDYIKNLANGLIRSYRANLNKVVLDVEADDVFLGIDAAIPCGLIINELISNSLKHAFPGGREGKLKVIMRFLNGDNIELVVSDNGVSIPEDVDIRNTKSLGLQLVIGLVENQLDGKIELNRENGTEFRISFKELKYKNRL